MKHRYTARLHFNDDETIVYHGDEIDELLRWMNQQVEGCFDEVYGDILDHHTNQIAKEFHYMPPE